MLLALYAGLPFVEVAYLLEVAPPEHPEQHTFLIAIGVASEHAERAARATITALQSTATQADIPIDLTSFDPAQDPPDYLRHTGVQRFFGPRLSQHCFEEQRASMKIEDFAIGTEFQTSTGQRWRCTDVGRRAILAIELDPDLNEAWFAGPPYPVPEVVFDEIEIRRTFRTIEEATWSALEAVREGGHPGYPGEVVAIMMKARAANASRRYTRSSLLRIDRVDPGGELLHPYAAEPSGDDWIIQVYLPFRQEFRVLPEAEFIQLRPVTQADMKMR